MEEFEASNSMERNIVNRAAMLQRPINGALELTPLCNMNCRMCYIRMSRSEMEERGRLRTAEEWIRVGRKLQEAGVLFLLLTGGEPLLHPGFKDIYLAFLEMGFFLTINTNGTLIDEEWADFFAEHKPRRINITLYGASRETYQSLCGYEEGFEKTIRGIKLLKERGVAIKLNGSITRQNVAELDQMYAFAREEDLFLHADTYMIPGILEAGLPPEKQSRLTPEMVAEATLKALEREMGTGQFSPYLKKMIEMVESPGETAFAGGISCLAGNCSFYINWQGVMTPCVSLKEPSANVFEADFEAAWEYIAKAAKAIRMGDKCTTCKLRPICKVCPATTKLETGRWDKEPQYLCEFARAQYELMRKMVLQMEENSDMIF